MSKTKNKNGSELEYLRGEVRRYKCLCRSLQREIQSLKKKEHFYEDLSDIEDEEAEESRITKLPCSDCGKGMMDQVVILNRVFHACPICGSRTHATIIAGLDGED